MKGADGFVQGYNAQLAVDEEAQVIVAQGVTDQPPDNGNLAPMIEPVEGHPDETPANATADAGYWNPEAEGRARALGTEAWVSTERQRHGGEKRSDSETSETDPPDGETEPADVETDPLKRMRAPPGAEPFPGPGGRKDAEVSPSAGERLGQAEQLLLSDPKRLFLALGTAPACPRGLREVPRPPTLPSTRRFMNNPGSFLPFP